MYTATDANDTVERRMLYSVGLHLSEIKNIQFESWWTRSGVCCRLELFDFSLNWQRRADLNTQIFNTSLKRRHSN